MTFLQRLKFQAKQRISVTLHHGSLEKAIKKDKADLHSLSILSWGNKMQKLFC